MALLEPARDRGVVSGDVRECLRRQRLAGGRREPALGLTQLGEHRVVGLGADDRRDEGKVLRRRADHRRPADVDVLDHLRVGHSVPRGGPLERVQVDAHEVDQLDVVLLGRAHVRRVVAYCQQRRMELRMKRLHPPVHDLRETGQVGHLAGLDAGVRQRARRPPVETISIPSSARPRANSTTPVLSDTDSSARATLTCSEAIGSNRLSDSVPGGIARL